MRKIPRPAASGGANRAGTSKGLGGTFDPQFSFETNGPQDSVVPIAPTRSRSSLQKDRTVWNREPGRAGPIRLVVGFLRIVLVVENVPGLGWHILDYFPLVSASDGDLLMVVEEMRRYGYGSRFRVEGDLSPAVFSPLGVRDPEAREAMERLGNRGLEISKDITGIVDPEFLWWPDGPRPRGAR